MAPFNPRSSEYVASVGLRQMVAYVARVGLKQQTGSRREHLANLLWYRRFVAHVRPRLIHVQHPLERALYVRWLRRLEHWKLPMVVTAHSLFAEHPENTIHQLMAPNLRAADRVIAVSDHVADQAIQLGVDPHCVRVIRSGVDTQRFRPRNRSSARERLGISPQAKVVLFVGNLEPRKQVDVLIRAVAAAHEHVPELTLLVVGSGESAGSDDQTARLLQLVSELDMRGVVRFLGRVDERRLMDCYAAAEVFVLPSASEAQGIVALEAMACGLPVVASAVGGLLGTVKDGETGYLVPSGDIAGVSGRLQDVLLDDSRGAAFGASARAVVERGFTWQRAIEATIEVYREVLACRS
jgi:D-inositol-3-phosphate glycosyltransferase